MMYLSSKKLTRTGALLIVPIRPSGEYRISLAYPRGGRLALALQDILVCVNGHFFGLAVQNKIHSSSGISSNPDLTEAYHTVSKIGEDGDEHGEMVAHLALRELGMDLHFSTVGGLQFILESITRHFGAINPLIKKPIEAPVSLNVHLFSHMLLRNGFEGFRGGGNVAVTFHEVVHHVDEGLIALLGRALIRIHE